MGTISPSSSGRYHRIPRSYESAETALKDPRSSCSAMSNSYNPSPLMMGAAAYLVLFFPVVVAARWVETKFAWKR